MKRYLYLSRHVVMASAVNALCMFSVQIHDVLCVAMMAEAALPIIAMMTLSLAIVTLLERVV